MANYPTEHGLSGRGDRYPIRGIQQNGRVHHHCDYWATNGQLPCSTDKNAWSAEIVRTER